MLGLFNNCDQDPIEVDINLDKKNLAFKELSPGRKPNLYYLVVMREFRQRVKKMVFYEKHRHLLNQFSIISVFTSA